MELYEIELKDAIERLCRHGRDKTDFSFKVTYLPPDPDDVVMYTMRYEVEITDATSSKSLVAVGGIGLDWVGYFEEALEGGHFD